MRKHLLAGLCVSIVAAAGPVQAATETAIFAGGCFWSIEHDLEEVPGVVSAVSGYTGGSRKNPTYENHEGHVEAVKVVYDPAKISYRQLTDRFLHRIDPTQADGMFCDRGSSYLSAIFVKDAKQKADADAALGALRSGPFKGKKVFTPVRQAQAFWQAEAYHQDFAKRNPAHYNSYKVGCGRERALKAAWGGR